MIKTAIKMIRLEKKQAFSVAVSVFSVLLICTIFLQLFHNPYLVLEPNTPSSLLVIPLLILSVIIISSTIITYSFNYYMRQNSKEFGLVRVAGYDIKKLVLYYMIKIGIVYLGSILMAIVMFLIITPILQYVIYSILNIHGNIFNISSQAILI